MPADLHAARPLRWPLAALLCAALLGFGTPASAAKVSERTRQKAQAELTRSALRQKLTTLQQDIGRTESEKDDAADTLAASEKAISEAKRSLRELADEQAATNQTLHALGVAQDQLKGAIEAQKKQLAKLLREHYVAGNEDRIKLLLSGENPNRIHRDLQLMAYVSQAQARLLGALRTNLTAIEANAQQTQSARDTLDEIAQEQRDQQAQLEKQKAHRVALLGTLSKRLVAQRKQAGTLERDEQRMAGLVDKLSRLIKEQTEAAAAEKRRLAALAAERAQELAREQAQAKLAAEAKAERERIARASRAQGKPSVPLKPAPILVDQPKVVQPPVPPKPDPNQARAADIALAPVAPHGAFARLRGQLRSPSGGKLMVKFGSKHGDGPKWKGVFIKATEGSEVKVVAAGRVVWADWMRGFGNLIVVDHGNEYLSIYGNNQSLLKHLGDAVKGGEPIASVGNTGGNEESGLYFELRHQGQAFDPALWVKF